MAAINKPSQPLVPAEIDPVVLDSKADLVNGEVPSEQLPSYVDDVLEFTDVDSFPEEGESGKIYVALDTNSTYRWSGSAYIQVGGSGGDSSTPPVIDLQSTEPLPLSAFDPRILALTPDDYPITCLINFGSFIEVGTIAVDRWGKEDFFYSFQCSNGIINFIPDGIDPKTEEQLFSVDIQQYRVNFIPQFELEGGDLTSHVLNTKPDFFETKPGPQGRNIWLAVPSMVNDMTRYYYGLVTPSNLNEFIFSSQNGTLRFLWNDKEEEGFVDITNWHSAQYLKPTIMGAVNSTAYDSYGPCPEGPCDFRVTFPSGIQCTYPVNGWYDSENGEMHYEFDWDPNTEIIITDNNEINWEHFHEQDPGTSNVPFDPTFLPKIFVETGSYTLSNQFPAIDSFPETLPAGPLTPNVLINYHEHEGYENQYGFMLKDSAQITLLDDQFNIIPGAIGWLELDEKGDYVSNGNFMIQTSHIAKLQTPGAPTTDSVAFAIQPVISDAIITFHANMEAE